MDIDAQKPQTKIDAICLGPNRQPQFSEKQKEALKILERCFRCREDKHLAKDCPKFPPPARTSGVTGPSRGCTRTGRLADNHRLGDHPKLMPNRPNPQT